MCRCLSVGNELRARAERDEAVAGGIVEYRADLCLAPHPNAGLTESVVADWVSRRRPELTCASIERLGRKMAG